MSALLISVIYSYRKLFCFFRVESVDTVVTLFKKLFHKVLNIFSSDGLEKFNVTCVSVNAELVKSVNSV